VAKKMIVLSNYDDEVDEPKSLFIKLWMVIFFKKADLFYPCLNFCETCNNLLHAST
jgi:hypothetical protein